MTSPRLELGTRVSRPVLDAPFWKHCAGLRTCFGSAPPPFPCLDRGGHAGEGRHSRAAPLARVRRRDLARHLEAHGCELLREGGHHSVYVNRRKRKTATVPRHREVDESVGPEDLPIANARPDVSNDGHSLCGVRTTPEPQ